MIMNLSFFGTFQRWAALLFLGVRFPLVRYHFFLRPLALVHCHFNLPVRYALFRNSGSFRYALSYTQFSCSRTTGSLFLCREGFLFLPCNN